MLINPQLLDIIDGNSLRFTVSKFVVDDIDVRSSYDSRIVRQRALRIFPAFSSPSHGDGYFDLLSRGLIDRLMVRLESGDYSSLIFTLTKHGNGPASEWQVSVDNQGA